jgi:hypothetical protein
MRLEKAGLSSKLVRKLPFWFQSIFTIPILS